jgi:intraflagellar transport protein 172
LKARDVFYKLVASLRKQSKGTTSSMKEFEKLLLVVHYGAVRVHARNYRLDELVATLSLTLLRFTTIIPPDRAFYEAGVDCKAVDWLNIAFVMYNRYLDLAEAMEDESVSQVDNSDFAGTEIPAPHEFRIPDQQWLPDNQREAVRDWVLTISMDQKLEQSLPKGALPTPEEASKSRCIVSGVPILHSSHLMN